MNIYTTEFFARCPNNNVRIKYSLRIEHAETVTAEDLIEVVEGISAGFHEDIADRLQKRFGGNQTLTADHHGVHIETQRP